jgi:uncharacterized protein
MKLHPDRSSAPTITSYGPGWVAVNGQKIDHSVILSSSGEQTPWACQRFEDLGEPHFAQLATLNCEVLLFGSGQRLRFVSPAWLTALMARRIGLETMDTAAACRTYNILAGEGRKVAVALLLERAMTGPVSG